ncbi:hypothetical protein [Microbulbifer spongiae]|uniref:Uncharacterized protein n=1 Tax=Microbulbifer spongiae TaxID=2944933 RepID=A0ABY9ECL2_9GAMM|nr:hypothetical protein [Microbulbifer sp. MI-G]WKD49696.1 hypothetical protein M8T91_17675 [Microbulbifer sp. MI-G]
MLKKSNKFNYLAVSILFLGFTHFSQGNVLEGDCSVQLQCPDNSIVSCEGTNASCFTGSDYVSCNGQVTQCETDGGPEPCTAPPVLDIVENIPAFYPPMHPFGRYSLAGMAGPNYVWSVNYGQILGDNTGGAVVIKSASIGWFTITVTASSTVPGCNKTTTFSENFYVEADPRLPN